MSTDKYTSDRLDRIEQMLQQVIEQTNNQWRRGEDHARELFNDTGQKHASDDPRPEVAWGAFKRHQRAVDDAIEAQKPFNKAMRDIAEQIKNAPSINVADEYEYQLHGYKEPTTAERLDKYLKSGTIEALQERVDTLTDQMNWTIDKIDNAQDRFNTLTGNIEELTAKLNALKELHDNHKHTKPDGLLTSRPFDPQENP